MVDNTLRVARLEREVRWLRVITVVTTIVAITSGVLAWRALHPSKIQIGAMTLEGRYIAFEDDKGGFVEVNAAGVYLRSREQITHVRPGGLSLRPARSGGASTMVNLVLDRDAAWLGIDGPQHQLLLRTDLERSVISADNNDLVPAPP